MSNKKILAWIFTILGVVVVVLLVLWIVSRIGGGSSQLNPEDLGIGNTPASLDVLPIVEPVGMNIGFRVPKVWFARFDNDNKQAYFSNNPDFSTESGGYYVVEMHGRLVLPAGSSLPQYALGSLVSPNAKVTTMGKTLGGFDYYRFDNISSSGSTGVAYAVDHGNGEFSFWQTDQYSELPIMDEVVATVSPKIQQ